MNLINDDSKVAISDLQRALHVLKCSSNSDRKLDAYTGLRIFQNQSSTINNKEICEIFREFDSLRTSSDLREILQMQREYVLESFQNYQNNSTYIKKIFKKQQDLINKVKPAHSFIIKQSTPISANDIYKTVAHYYLKNDKESLAILNELIMKRNILASNVRGVSGQTIICKTFNNDYLGIVESYDFYTMLTLVHEIAHIKRIRNLKKQPGYEKINRYIRQNDFLELPPYLAEKKFLEYLINHDYYIDEAIKYQLIENVMRYSMCIDFLLKNDDNLSRQSPGNVLSSLRILYGNLFSNLKMRNNDANIEDWDYNSPFISQDLVEQTFSKDELVESALYPLEQAKKLVK